MSQRYNCEKCGEMYHEENIEWCPLCRRMICPRCTSRVEVPGGRAIVCTTCEKNEDMVKALESILGI